MKRSFLCLILAVGFTGCERQGESFSRPKGDMQVLACALKMYHINNGHFPSTAQGLQALVTKPTGDPEPNSWTQLADRIPVDPWGQPYHYVCPNPEVSLEQKNAFMLLSAGKDSVLGTEDDLKSEWD